MISQSNILFWHLASSCLAFEYFRDRIPNGRRVQLGHVKWQAVGHSAPWRKGHCAGEFEKNYFGHAFETHGFEWTYELCMEDSDDDGRSNGEELGDPHCIFGTHRWTDSKTAGAGASNITHPGFDESLSPFAQTNACNLSRVVAQSRRPSQGDDVESHYYDPVTRQKSPKQMPAQLLYNGGGDIGVHEVEVRFLDDTSPPGAVDMIVPRAWVTAQHLPLLNSSFPNRYKVPISMSQEEFEEWLETIDSDEVCHGNGTRVCESWFVSNLATSACSSSGSHARLKIPVSACIFVFVNIVIPIWAVWMWKRLRRKGRWLGVNVWGIWAMIFLITQVGISAGFHRYFTHRSYEASVGVQWSLALIGQLAMQGDAFYWAALHRTHHRLCDLEGDPHSPHTHSYFHSHGGFVWNDRSNDFDYRLIVPDLFHSPHLKWVASQSLLSIIGLPLLSHLLFGVRRTLFYLHVPQFLGWQATQLINSACHLWGYSPYKRDAMSAACVSKNSPWLWPFVYGEVWHNNHHSTPSSARFGSSPWELDPAHWLICILEQLGLVWNVRRESRPPDNPPCMSQSLRVIASSIAVWVCASRLQAYLNDKEESSCSTEVAEDSKIESSSSTPSNLSKGIKHSHYSSQSTDNETVPPPASVILDTPASVLLRCRVRELVKL